MGRAGADVPSSPRREPRRSRHQPEPSEIRGYTARGKDWEWRASWFLLFFLTYFLYWVPLVYMGLRVLQFRWVLYGLFYAPPLVLLGLVKAMFGGHPEAAGLITYLWYSTSAFWVFAFVHTMVARGEFLVRLADAEDERDDLGARQRARMEAEYPPPPQAPQNRLLDLNTATEAELAMLPGMGPETARQAVYLRTQHGGFRSFRHFAEQLQLPPRAADRLRSFFDDDPEPPKPPEDPAYRVLLDGRRVLELNWASAEAISALPGMGPEAGRRALALRDSDGPFKSLEDFRFRMGLPMDVMTRISDYASVSMAPRPTQARGGGRVVDA